MQCSSLTKIKTSPHRTKSFYFTAIFEALYTRNFGFMIAFVRGKFARKTPAQIVVDVNGVGYELQISLNTYSFISNKDEGQLHTYLHITENGQTLFGFYAVDEKELFYN